MIHSKSTGRNARKRVLGRLLGVVSRKIKMRMESTCPLPHNVLQVDEPSSTITPSLISRVYRPESSWRRLDWKPLPIVVYGLMTMSEDMEQVQRRYGCEPLLFIVPNNILHRRWPKLASFTHPSRMATILQPVFTVVLASVVGTKRTILCAAVLFIPFRQSTYFNR